MTGSGEWSLAKRIAFRFGFVLGFWFVFPFPLGYIPKTDFLAEYATKPIEWMSVWVAETLFGVADPYTGPTGSGDTSVAWSSWFAFAVIAAVVTIAWSILDRDRRAYPRLAAAATVVLRYVLGFSLLTYGLIKLIPAQMPALDAVRLDEHIGEQSPMGMLWHFMGSSPPYEMFAGACETIGGLLLFSRRTATLGALVSAGVLTNVVVLNFTYDVPVKLYSSQLLLIALALAYPQLRRIATAVLGGAVEAVPPRTRSTRGRERARLALKIAVLVTFAVNLGLQCIDSYDRATADPGALAGSYAVDAYRGPGAAWIRVSINAFQLAVRHADDTRTIYAFADDEHPPTATSTQLPLTDPEGKPVPPLAIAHPAPDRLVLDGAAGLHVELHRLPAPLLTTRGFHWVQELPFHR